jgi:hypothetical protein
MSTLGKARSLALALPGVTEEACVVVTLRPAAATLLRELLTEAWLRKARPASGTVRSGGS